MSMQRISYVPLENMTPEMRADMERCAREGTPRPESSAVRAHVLQLRGIDSTKDFIERQAQHLEGRENN